MGYGHRRKRKASNDLVTSILEEWRVGVFLAILSFFASFGSFLWVAGKSDEPANIFLVQLFPRFAWVFEYSLPLMFLVLGIFFSWAAWISWVRAKERFVY